MPFINIESQGNGAKKYFLQRILQSYATKEVFSPFSHSVKQKDASHKVYKTDLVEVKFIIV